MKGNILQGTARGRMGEIVAKVVHGEQILSKYQPNVSNPNTFLQKQVRRTFSDMSKIMAKIRKDLYSFGIKPVYATYSGASKSLQNIVVPFGFLHSEITRAGGNNIKLISDDLLLTQGVTGNVFECFIDPVTQVLSFGKKSLATGLAYFGSDNYIAPGQLIGMSVCSAEQKSTPRAYVSISSSNPSLKDNANFINFPKGYGMQDSQEDVGGWKYIYQITQPIIVDGGAESIDFSATKTQQVALGVVYDVEGRVIAQGVARIEKPL